MFYAHEVRAGRAFVTGESAEHLRRVLRVEAGQKYELSDGARLYLAEIAGFGPRGRSNSASSKNCRHAARVRLSSCTPLC